MNRIKYLKFSIQIIFLSVISFFASLDSSLYGQTRTDAVPSIRFTQVNEEGVWYNHFCDPDHLRNLAIAIGDDLMMNGRERFWINFLDSSLSRPCNSEGDVSLDIALEHRFFIWQIGNLMIAGADRWIDPEVIETLNVDQVYKEDLYKLTQSFQNGSVWSTQSTGALDRYRRR